MTHISELPDDCFLEIFSYLSYSELKSASLVSTAWNDVISNSSTFLSRTRIHVDSLKYSPNDHQQTVARNYRSVRLDLDLNDPSQLLKDISTISEHFIEVFMDIRFYLLYQKASLPTYSTLTDCIINFLKTCTNARIVSITSDFINSIDQPKSAIEPFNLKNLRNLHARGCSWIFNSIRCDELDTLTIDYRDNVEESHSNVDDLIDFLNNLNRLSTVSLYNVKLLSNHVLQPKFKWNEMRLGAKKYSCTLYTTREILEEEKENWKILSKSSNEHATLGFESFEKEHNISKIVLDHVRSIEELSIHHVVHQVYNHRIFDSATDFELLIDVYNEIPFMMDVKRLKLSFGTPSSSLEMDEIDDSGISEILRKCPNVESLHLDFDILSGDYGLRRLKHLTVPRCTEDLRYLDIPSLESVKITHFDPTNDDEFDNLEPFANVNRLSLKTVHVKLKDAIKKDDLMDYIFSLFEKLYDITMTAVQNFTISYNVSIPYIRNTEYTEHMSRDEIEMRNFGLVLTSSQRYARYQLRFENLDNNSDEDDEEMEIDDDGVEDDQMDDNGL